MRILVEGPDGAGKTTLISNLLKRYPEFTLVRNSLEDKQDFEQWWTEVLKRQHDFPEVPIHDRFFYSELVYGPVIRGRVNAEPGLVENIQFWLRKSALLIYCRPRLSQIRENLKQNTHMDGVEKNIDQITVLYDHIFTNREAHYYGRRLYVYDYTREQEPAAVMETVRGYLSGELT